MATVPLRQRMGFLSFLMESSGLFSDTTFFGVKAFRILIIRGAIVLFTELKQVAEDALDSKKMRFYFTI